MKVGDLITKKAHSRLYRETTPPLRTVVRVVRSSEPRLHGKAPFYIMLDDNPGKWKDPSGYFIVSAA